MTVTAIIPAKKKPNRFNVYLDDEYAFNVHYDTLNECGIFKDAQLDEEKLEEILSLDKEKKAKAKAFDLLSRRDFSKKGIKRKLMEKGIDEENAEIQADYLEERGYINDESYAKNAAKYLFDVKGFGRQRVVNELVLRGIDKVIAKEITEEYESSNEDRIHSVLSKLMKGKDLSDKKAVKSLYDKLIRLGYTYEDIKKAFIQLTMNSEK
jgi:regulatory protein